MSTAWIRVHLLPTAWLPRFITGIAGAEMLELRKRDQRRQHLYLSFGMFLRVQGLTRDWLIDPTDIMENQKSKQDIVDGTLVIELPGGTK